MIGEIKENLALNVCFPARLMVCMLCTLLARLLAGKVESLARLLERWHAKLKNWHAIDTMARLLARWHVKMTSWHAFGTLTWARGHVDYAGTHDTRHAIQQTSSQVAERLDVVS